MLRVPLLDLKAQYAGIRSEILETIDRVCESEYFILGPEVTALEEEIARYCGVRFAIGMSSGTDALLAGYRKGDFPEWEAAAKECRALPVFPELTEGQQNAVVGAIREFFL